MVDDSAMPHVLQTRRRDPAPTVPQVADTVVLEELAFVKSIVSHHQTAREIVASAKDAFPKLWRGYLQDHRDRPDKVSPKNKREPYRPIFGKRELLRTLVLDEIAAWERRQEHAGNIFSDEQRLQIYLRLIVLLILNRNSYYAAVAIMQVLCNYATEALHAVYRKIDPDRAHGKNQTTSSRTKNAFFRCAQERFPDLQIQKRGAQRSICSRAPRPAEVDLVVSHLQPLLPPAEDAARDFP